MKSKFTILFSSAIAIFGQEIPDEATFETAANLEQEIPSETASETVNESCCYRGPHPYKVTLRHLEYQGIGYNQGYSTLNLFLSNPPSDNVCFLDARVHVFNSGKPAVNVGLGWRHLFEDRCYAFGVNSYYDYRKTRRKNYNQYGAGVEFLASNWEFRVNGYLPFGQRKSKLFDLEFSHFAGNQFYVSRKHEFSMAGGDAEIGWHFL